MPSQVGQLVGMPLFLIRMGEELLPYRRPINNKTIRMTNMTPTIPLGP